MHHPTVIYIDIVMPCLNALSFPEVCVPVGSSTSEKSPPAPSPPSPPRRLGSPWSRKRSAGRPSQSIVVVFLGRRHPYAWNEGTKHDVRDPLLVVGTDGNKIRIQKILHSHTSSDKPPKITSQKIIADEKFL